MKKSEIERSYHMSHRGNPMINVKLHNLDHGTLLKTAEKYSEYEFKDPLFRAWLDTHLEDEKLWHAAYDCAIERGWDLLQDDAMNAFPGFSPKVWSAGRSGGWCVVEKLPDVDTWDAIMVGRWTQFCRYAQQCCDGVPYDMVDYLYHNVFPEYRDKVDEDMAL